MTHKQRLLAVLNGEKPDRIPWIPRMKLWYEFHKSQNNLPQPYGNATLEEIRNDLGMGNPARKGRVFDLKLTGEVEVEKERDGLEVTTTYHTPKGTVTNRDKSSQEEYDLETVEHLIKGPEDYEVVEYLIRHMKFVPTYDKYRKYEKEIGETGVPLVRIGLWPPGSSRVHCPMHRILRGFIGYERAYKHLLNQYPDKVTHLLETLTGKAKEMQEVALNSPAQFFLHGAHFDVQMTSPPIFEEYFLPYFRDFTEKLHAKSKKLACHLDAETKGLYSLISESGFDVADCFTTKPLVQKTTLEEARNEWGEKMIIWGGIPSTILEPGYPQGKFKDHVVRVLQTVAPGENFILGIADNLMPSSDFSRVVALSEMMKEIGEYPLDPGEVEKAAEKYLA